MINDLFVATLGYFVPVFLYSLVAKKDVDFTGVYYFYLFVIGFVLITGIFK